MTLLDEAKKYKFKKYTKLVITEEDIELVIAWLKDEIQIGAIQKIYRTETATRDKLG